MYLDLGQIAKLVGPGPMTTFMPGSVGTGPTKLKAGAKPKVTELEAQVIANADIAKKAKSKAKSASKDKEAKKKVIQNAIALTRSTSGKFKKGIEMGWWPADQIASAATSAYNAVADTATELVTGISKEQIQATEKVAAAQARMIQERVASGAMTAAKGAELTAITKEAEADAKAAASAANVLKDTAAIATNRTLTALGLPSMETTWKYIKYGIPIVGALVLALVAYPYIKAARAPGEALQKAATAASKNRW